MEHQFRINPGEHTRTPCVSTRAARAHLPVPFLLGIGLIMILSGCEQVVTPETVNPVLVTLPAQSPMPTLTFTPIPPTETPVPTFRPTDPVPPTPAPQSQGIGATRLLWEWDEVARPSTLAATSTRLAVIVADGRFVWLDAINGQVEVQTFLWAGQPQGDSWGEIYADGTLAVTAIREVSINPETRLADSRARLAVYDTGAEELWSLPELESLHFYSAALAPGMVLVGKWPYGFKDNALSAHEVSTGEIIWEVQDDSTGFQQIVHDGTRLYVLLNDAEGGGAASYDLLTGEELWRWSDPAVKNPDQLVLSNSALYIFTANRTVTLDPFTGKTKWSAQFSAAPEAGLIVGDSLFYLVPAPSPELGTRPGLVALSTTGGEVAWHTLNGLLADPIAMGEGVLWTIVKDFDSGEVGLSGLEPATGLEQVRVMVGSQPNILYQLVAQGNRVYVLGDSLQAFGY